MGKYNKSIGMFAMTHPQLLTRVRYTKSKK